MTASFLLYLAFVTLWPLGAGLFAACAVGLFAPKYRRYSRAGFIWGVPCGVAVFVPIALVGFEMTRHGLPEFGFFLLLIELFCAGFAIGVFLWCAFHFRALRHNSAV